MRYRFGRFELQPEERRLLVDGAVTPLTSRAFDLLVALVERAGQLVGKDELLARVWPKLVVEESNLQVQVSALRKVLDAESIETVAGSGYRFLPKVDAVKDGAPPVRETRRHNLPRSLTRFIGPEGQVEAYARMLDTTRLLTVIGAAGLGKTRLSQEMAETRLDRYEDGVWLVELAPLTDARLVPQTVATVLGVQDTAGGDLLEIVKEYVRERRMLLLLDNCEHLLQECAQFARQLLETSPHLKVLATSREALHLAGEATLPMSPLTFPADGPVPSLDALACYDAVRLFVDRAGAVSPGFALTEANARTIAHICAQLDGIPLAIELAAARVRIASVDAIAQRLHDRFRLLKGSDSTADPRHRTLQATLDWSYDLLTPAEQRLLQRVSVFSGGCTLEAAEAVGAGDGTGATEVLDLLAQLVEKSLVVFDSARERYRLLETIRQYASVRLEAAGATGEARQSHLSHCLVLAEREERCLFGPDEEASNARLDRERDNLRVAYTWSAHTGSASATLNLFFHLRRWFCRGEFEPVRPFLIDALALAHERDLTRCRGLFVMGYLSYWPGRYDDAVRYAAESLAIARELGDEVRTADALQVMGIAGLGLGDIEPSRLYLEEAVALAKRAGDQEALSDALNSLAELYSTAGELDLSKAVYEEALVANRAAGARDFATVNLINLARVAISRGAPADSVRHMADAMATADLMGSTRKAHGLLQICAGLAAMRAEWERAARLFAVTDRLMREMGYRVEPADEAVLAPLLARTRVELGDAAFAAAHQAGSEMGLNAALDEVRGWLVVAS